MKLIFEYEQDGQIDGLAAKAAFQAALDTAGHHAEFDKVNSKTVMRLNAREVGLQGFRIQQTTCNVRLAFEEAKSATTRPAPDSKTAQGPDEQQPSGPALEDGSPDTRQDERLDRWAT